MKKIFLSLLIVLSAGLISSTNLTALEAKTISPIVNTKAKPVAKPVTVKAKAVNTKAIAKPKASSTTKYKTTMKWDASGLKYLNNFAAFDYSTTIRNAVIKKIENYARRHHINVITKVVINSMRE